MQDDVEVGYRYLAEFVATPVIEDPYPAYALLRSCAPVCYVEAHNTWLISRYRDCLAVLKNGSLFVPSDGREVFGRGRSVEEDADEEYTPYQTLLYTALALKRRVQSIEPEIDLAAGRLIDTFAGEGRVEFISRFARQLPRLIIGKMFGLEQSEWTAYFERRLAGMGRQASATAEPGERQTGGGAVQRAAFWRSLERAMEERRRQPRDDVLGAIVQSDSQRLEQRRIVQMIEQVAMNAALTTSDLTGNAAWLLASDAGAAARLRANPALVANAIDEVLRFEAPVQGLFRRTTMATAIGDVCIPAGAELLVLTGSANRDAAQFAEAERFDSGRVNAGGHLAFGYGIHACIGASLARRIAAGAIRRLFDRLPGVRPVEGQEIRHCPNKLNRGLQALWLEWA